MNQNLEGQTIARASRRFYVDSLPEVGRPFTMSGDEAHHMLNVLRVRAGEDVCLFDGSGDVAYARLVGGRRKEAALEILGRETIDVEPARKLALACALPRATRMDYLVEKCAELGLRRLIPMVTQRSVVDPLERQQNHREGHGRDPVDRWRRTVIEAAKQCGRTRLTESSAVLPFDAALLTNEPDAARMIASPEPGGISLSEFASRQRPQQPIIAFIGPEGGFTPEELDEAARSGCVPVSLGPRILRVETAAVALTAVLLLT